MKKFFYTFCFVIIFILLSCSGNLDVAEGPTSQQETSANSVSANAEPQNTVASQATETPKETLNATPTLPPTETLNTMSTVEPMETPEYTGEQIVVDFATIDDDININSRITLFENKHPGIRINKVTYSGRGDIAGYFGTTSNSKDYLGTYLDSLRTALMAGVNVPDIIRNPGSGYFSTQQDNGLFIDFYDLMNNDPEFNMDDYYTNIF